MSDALLPCPFCGSAQVNARGDYASAFVICDDCKACGPMVFDDGEFDAGKTRAGAVRAWSLRTARFDAPAK